MPRKLFLVFINYILLFKISHAQYSNQRWPNAPPVPNTKLPIAPNPAPTPTGPPILERIPAKCYPETATAYFIPAPPSSPKITVLDLKNVSPDMKPNLQEIISHVMEVPSGLPSKRSCQKTESSAFPPPPPPPPCSTVLPDLMDEMPSKIQDRFSQLVKSKDATTVCNSCASLLKKSPIFRFDQELLDGFLAGIGL